LTSYSAAATHAAGEGPGAFRKAMHIPISHSIIFMNLVKLNYGVSDRLFATWFTWRAEVDG